MAQVKRARRYYHGQRFAAALFEEWDLVGFWRWKQEQEPGVALPLEFPHLTGLADKGYTTHEDLDGADEAELRRAGFDSQQATSILSALADLPPLSTGAIFRWPGVDTRSFNEP